MKKTSHHEVHTIATITIKAIIIKNKRLMIKKAKVINKRKEKAEVGIENEKRKGRKRADMRNIFRMGII